MVQKTIQVWFAKTLVGEDAAPLAQHLEQLLAAHGRHLPPIEVGQDRLQIRALEKVGTVWKGCFAKLKHEAPHVVNGQDEELELQIEDGASIIEKCMFLYREQSNLLIWHNNISVGGLNRAADYFSQLLRLVVMFPTVQDTAQMERMMAQDIYEVEFDYAKPPAVPQGVDQWSQRYFDIMNSTGAARGHFVLRAARHGTLAQEAKRGILRAVQSPEFRKIKVKLAPGDDPIKLYQAPIRDEFTIELFGRYPNPDDVYRGLENAYDRQRAAIDQNAA